jgi:hypothetical protein
MAKQARSVEHEISDRQAQKFLKDVMERYGNIEAARARFKAAADRERGAMTALYEGMAARGISQKASKTNVKIALALEKIRGWLADLQAEDRRMAQKLAKAQQDKHQLMLFGDLPKQPKPERAADAKPKRRKGSGVTGEDLNVIEFREGA